MSDRRKPRYCTKRLMHSSRPRIQYNAEGVCNACTWAEEKKTLDWRARWKELEKLCEKHRARNKDLFDVIVPYSGGKNGAYIAYTLREKLGMHPLCVTVRPPMQDPIGAQNIKNFLERGFHHVLITPNRLVERRIAKQTFITKATPHH